MLTRSAPAALSVSRAQKTFPFILDLPVCFGWSLLRPNQEWLHPARGSDSNKYFLVSSGNGAMTHGHAQFTLQLQANPGLSFSNAR